MTQTRRFTDDAGWQEQAGYSRAVRRGHVIAVSGTTAHRPGRRRPAPAATPLRPGADCLRRSSDALTALGGSLDDVVRTVVYLAPGASWEEAARRTVRCSGVVRPASTMLYVASLIGDGFLVEIEAHGGGRRREVLRPREQ